ncbi:polyprenyl synthetase family protein [Zhihengliuella flava]|uniref:Geranylgeranyl diphosphate synthase type II n=1 Tax=Zhihengliuella flava TaxID=1285193 RepID=A0A931DBW3_9MICC|nr:polyprenyl synthetase family protein [Zhihengliuella flava]MBG6084581.1 geranylgeranyl diphosphate synthase type II [Zhihengliuella flava]
MEPWTTAPAGPSSAPEMPSPGGNPVGRVEEVLAQFFMDGKLRAAATDPAYLTLWEALEQAVAGGKRSRPQLVLAAYQHLARPAERAAENAVLLAASFELLHSAFVVHDDVIDRDTVRRGVPNVSGRYRQRALRDGADADTAAHAGDSAGLLAGDLALSGAYRLLRRVRTAPERRERLHDILDEAIFASIGGELLDVELSRSPVMPTPERMCRTARCKTSVYSFEAPLEAGAVLAGADSSVVAALTSSGRHAGIAYQVVDDVLGVFGHHSRTGKADWGDLREGKRTVLLAYAATRPEWQHIAHLIGSPHLTAAEAEHIRRVLTDCGARDHAISVAEDNARRALDFLEHDGVPSPLRAELTALLQGVMDRVRPE